MKLGRLIEMIKGIFKCSYLSTCHTNFDKRREDKALEQKGLVVLSLQNFLISNIDSYSFMTLFETRYNIQLNTKHSTFQVAL